MTRLRAVILRELEMKKVRTHASGHRSAKGRLRPSLFSFRLRRGALTSSMIQVG